MSKAKIIVHCLVKNEENFIWYALNSVLPYVDKIMVWDNGSTDKTLDIIKSINSPKINLEVHPTTSREEVAHLRQEMLENTSPDYDWLLILDGDEIWPKSSILKVVSYISKHPETESIANWTTNLVGDIYHALPKTSGNYQIAGKKGNLNLHLINLKNIPGLHVSHPYGSEGYFDKNNIPIQQRSGVAFLNINYFHATHLLRSSQNKNVYDREIKARHFRRVKLSRKEIPSILIDSHPEIVPDVSQSQSMITAIPIIASTLHKRLSKKLFKHE